MTDGGDGLHGCNKGKAIYQYSKDGILLNKYSSAKNAAKKNNICACSISSVCLKKGITAGGFLWSFNHIHDISPKERKPILHKSVIQLNKNLEIINKFERVSDAAKELGLSKSGIRLICDNKTDKSKYILYYDIKLERAYGQMA